MARTWLEIRVDLLGGRGEKLDPRPGRIFICGPSHSFGQLGDAINQAFGRWDLSHLHDFELADGRRIGFPGDDDFGGELRWEDQSQLKPAKQLALGEQFTFTFDFGDNWHHHCRVAEEKMDPREEWGPGPLPHQPIPTWGWGSIPDQYGCRSAAERGLEE
ncbi:MAG: IS1096 element passenger TnpR family protein [Solirubrobacterales bacterium]